LVPLFRGAQELGDLAHVVRGGKGPIGPGNAVEE
jgi:hypothetical protein